MGRAEQERTAAEAARVAAERERTAAEAARVAAERKATAPRLRKGPFLLSILVYTILVIWSIYRVVHHSPEPDYQPIGWALLLGLASVVLFAVVLTSWLGFTGVGEVILGARTGTSSTVTFLWTATVTFALSYLSVFAIGEGDSLVCSPDTDTFCVLGSGWVSYLLLLGIPGATAALSVTPAPSAALLGDNDVAKATDQVTDVQYLVFNVLAMVLVLGQVLTGSHRLAEVPEVLLALTGASALGYVLNKRTQSARAGQITA